MGHNKQTAHVPAPICPSDTTLESAEALSRARVSPKGCTSISGSLATPQWGWACGVGASRSSQLTLEQIQAHSPTYIKVAKNLCAHFDVLNLCVRNDLCPVQSPSRQSMLADVEVLSVYVASLDLDKQSSNVAQCSRVSRVVDVGTRYSQIRRFRLSVPKHATSFELGLGFIGSICHMPTPTSRRCCQKLPAGLLAPGLNVPSLIRIPAAWCENRARHFLMCCTG